MEQKNIFQEQEHSKAVTFLINGRKYVPSVSCTVLMTAPRGVCGNPVPLAP